MKSKLKKLFRKKENPEKIEITVVDDNKELPDFRKIAVPDLKQYLINGYKEIREVKAEKEELKENLENARKYKDLYDAALVTLEEFRKRDEENKEIQTKLENKINKKETEITKLSEQVNTYKILEVETNQKIENIEKVKNEERNNAIKGYKEKLINEINNTKGNISKSKLFYRKLERYS